MKVERASVDSVKERLAALKRKKEQPKVEYGELYQQQQPSHGISSYLHVVQITDLDARIEARQREEDEAKRRKKERKKAKKEAPADESTEKDTAQGEGAANEEDEMAKLMGFGGFGSTKA
jgi:U4/U6.U5 tri-snRNP component SNU23